MYAYITNLKYLVALRFHAKTPEKAEDYSFQKNVFIFQPHIAVANRFAKRYLLN